LLKGTVLEERYAPGRIRSTQSEWLSEPVQTAVGSYYYGKYYPDVKKAQAVGRKLRGEYKYPIVKVPRDIYSPDIRAIKIDSKGSYLNNYIAYYYFSKNQNKSAHGKLAVVGQNIINEDFDLDEIYYWFGIYEEKIGGGSNILNPDPLAKNKYIAKDLENVTFIAPVVSLVHPSTLTEDSSKREALRWTDKIFEEQKSMDQLQQQIEEFKRARNKMTAAQKVREMLIIANKIEEEKLKNQSSFLNDVFGKKSA